MSGLSGALSALRPHDEPCETLKAHTERALVELGEAPVSLWIFCDRVETDWRAERDALTMTLLRETVDVYREQRESWIAPGELTEMFGK